MDNKFCTEYNFKIKVGINAANDTDYGVISVIPGKRTQHPDTAVTYVGEILSRGDYDFELISLGYIADFGLIFEFNIIDNQIIDVNKKYKVSFYTNNGTFLGEIPSNYTRGTLLTGYEDGKDRMNFRYFYECEEDDEEYSSVNNLISELKSNINNELSLKCFIEEDNENRNIIDDDYEDPVESSIDDDNGDIF